MKKILLLPLDDRPSNRTFPVDLAKIAGLKVLIPPRELLGNFTTPGESETLAKWMLEEGGAACAAIVSVDMLCFGGLVASRLPNVSTDAARRRLDTLRKLHKVYPELPIHAFNAIMRISITHDSPEKLSYWRDVAIYSQLAYRVEQLGQARWQEALAIVRKRIPSKILDGYLAARERNHIINQEAVRLAADGILQSLIICQEDTAPIGLHIPEQERLTELIEQLSVGERVFMHAGTDETTLTSLLRVVSEVDAWEPNVAVIYSSQEGSERVALYEDQPIRENMIGHIEACGGKLIDDPKKADLVMLVHTPTGPQREVVRRDAETDKRSRPQAKWLAKRAAALLKKGVRVAVADLAYCNGADEMLINALAEAGVIHALAGFGGWNTAGNSIGTALAQGLLLGLGEKNPRLARRTLAANLNFLFARLADDFLYQSTVRQDANSWIRSIGHTPVVLGDAKGRVERFVRKRMKEEADKLFQAGFAGRYLGGQRIAGIKKLNVHLPWPRTFEVEVEAKIELEPS